MHKYRVVERSAEESRLTIRCSGGRYHLTRALSVLPEVDARLEGDKPHLGFGILRCSKTGAAFRVIFESIGNTAMPSPNPVPGATDRAPGAGRRAPGDAA